MNAEQTPVSIASGEPVGTATAENEAWFKEQVYPLSANLKNYLRGSYPRVQDVDDIVQESFIRILRAKAQHPIRSSRAFLFTVARRLAIDWVRHEDVSPVTAMPTLEDLPAIETCRDVSREVAEHERRELLADAVAALPPRCREIFLLHKVKGLSRKAVAAELGLAEKTVDVQTTRGMRRVADYLRGRGLTGLYENES